MLIKLTRHIALAFLMLACACSRADKKDGNAKNSESAPVAAPAAPAPGAETATPIVVPTAPQPIDVELAAAFSNFGVEPLRGEDFLEGTPAQFELGRTLFFDKLISGNRNTSCATCHNPALGTSDGFSLAASLFARRNLPRNFTAADLMLRNASSLYNRGHISYKAMFWDSRVSAIPGGGYNTPAGNRLPPGLVSPLAAQALFPLTEPREMLGSPGDNEIAAAGEGNFIGIWNAIVNRVLAVPEYRELITAAYPGAAPWQINIVHLANALAIFQSMNWRSDLSPFDRYLQGDLAALSPEQKIGATLFYGKAQCARCHSGPLQTDQKSYAIAMPQFGPGVSTIQGDPSDYGLGRTTNRRADFYKFLTPSLRNVTLSGPWGHSGAYSSLFDIVRHHTNPAQANFAWDARQVIIPFPVPLPNLLGAHLYINSRLDISAMNEAQPVALEELEIKAIVAFLEALTEERFASVTEPGPQPGPAL